MGILKKMFGGGKGVDCVNNEDGTQTCRVFEREGEDLKATGTQVTLGVDPNTCQPMLVGEGSRILESDRDDVNELLKAKSQACRKGIA